MGLIATIAGLLALGSGVGIISAALGVGGGILMVPAFTTFIAGMDINTAKGSSSLIIAFVASYNSWRMNRGAMKTPWSVVSFIVMGSIVGAYAGAQITSRMSEVSVTWIFIGLLGLAGARTFSLEPPKVSEGDVRQRRLLAVVIGLASGIVAGATGTGGGAILVPLVLWSGICSNDRVVALSNTVMAVSALSSAFGHYQAQQLADLPWTFGQVTVYLAPFVVVGAILAAPLGRRINAALDLKRRRVVMGTLLLVIALRLAYRASM